MRLRDPDGSGGFTSASFVHVACFTSSTHVSRLSSFSDERTRQRTTPLRVSAARTGEVLSAGGWSFVSSTRQAFFLRSKRYVFGSDANWEPKQTKTSLTASYVNPGCERLAAGPPLELSLCQALVCRSYATVPWAAPSPP